MRSNLQPDKTIAALFTNSNQIHKRYKTEKLIKMDKVLILFSNTVKYLGITLDRKVSWKAHIDDKLQQCKKLMLLINAKLKGLQAPKLKLSKWAYTGVIRPKMRYGCMNWGNAIHTTSTTKSLKTLDKLATRSITTFQKNSPQASIEIMTDLIPIELMIKKTGLSSFISPKEQLSIPANSNSTSKILGEYGTKL